MKKTEFRNNNENRNEALFQEFKNFRKTNHFQKRASQRGICDFAVYLSIHYGDEQIQKGGSIKYILSEKCIKDHDLSQYVKNIDHYKNLHVILSPNNEIITAFKNNVLTSTIKHYRRNKRDQ